MATEQTRAPKLIIDRFTLSQRIEHLVMLLSFTILGVTGLVQKFAGVPIAETSIRVMGGIETVRIIHHGAAIVLLVLSAYHIIAVLNRIFVKRRAMTMLPGLNDVTDALDVVRYNLGLTKEHPKLPRYNFGEKFEYWAVIWGTAVMAITGFMLWNPVLTTNILPGSFIPAAKAAHGGEAILAILAILVWHVYNVHLKMFNRSIFTGKMPRNQMKSEHALELAQIDAGISRPLPDEAALRKRERIFLPVALLLAGVMGLAIFWFATYETTAITTLPEPVDVPVFSPLTATPIASPTVENNQLGVPIPHPIEGQEQCSTCHGPNGVRPYPADHAGRPDESCQVCHSPGAAADSRTTGSIAAAIPHTLEGKEQCSTCHGDAGSLVPMPAGHIQPVEDSACTVCHKPDAGAGDTTGSTMAAPTIPHPVGEDPYIDCTVCHGLDKMKPFPANHASFPVDQCTTCHQPAPAVEGATEATATPEAETETAAPSGPKPIPHPIEGDAYADCTVCHGAGKMKPFPENHASFASDSCTTCHKPAAAADAATPEATTAVTPQATTAATPAVTSTPAGAGAAPSSGPKPIPHSIVEPAYQDCIVCHGVGKLKPFPPSHEAFPVSVCSGCHQPKVEQ